MKMVTKESLKEGYTLSPCISDELMALQKWYIELSSNKEASAETIGEIFTEQLWDEYVLKRAEKIKKPKEELSRMKLELKQSRNMFEESDELVKAVNAREESGLNVSYKVETKEIPKLPPNKSLKGKLFDKWQGNFYVKMCQAKVNDILEEDCVPPKESDNGYDLHKTKDDFVKNHLLMAAMGLNAASFNNVKMQIGIQMYNSLLSIF